MKSKLILYLWCMCTFSACTSSGKGGKEETLYSGEIRIAVDESFKPIMEEELQVYHALTPEALITPIYCSEVEAVNLLLKDSVRLAVTNRRLTEEELISFHTRKFFPESILMALSGVALITHHSNPDSLITVEVPAYCNRRNHGMERIKSRLKTRLHTSRIRQSQFRNRTLCHRLYLSGETTISLFKSPEKQRRGH